jgi:hypothetical protein
VKEKLTLSFGSSTAIIFVRSNIALAARMKSVISFTGLAGRGLFTMTSSAMKKTSRDFIFENERFVPGEYVSTREENRMHVYKVCTVEHF